MDLFQSAAIANKSTHQEIAAVKLALLFSEEPDIPSQYRPVKKNFRRGDTLIMRRFRKNVSHWRNLIDTMMEKLEPELAWRFINITPASGYNGKDVLSNKDFILFSDYFILRRDKQCCDDDELGRLAQLYTAFQKNIEHGK